MKQPASPNQLVSWCLGLPPTWARRQARLAQAGGSQGLEEEVQIVEESWRRKFLWFPAERGDDGIWYQQPHWAVYYGSWSKPR